VRLGGTGKPVVAQPRAGQHSEREEPLAVPVVADAEPPTPCQLGDRAFCLPPVAAQPLRRVDPTAGDPHLDPVAGEVATAAALVIRPPCRRGPCRAGSAAHRPASEPWGGRPAAPRTTGLSLVLASVTSSDSGSPPPSTARCSLHPRLARSTGFAPVRSPLVALTNGPLVDPQNEYRAAIGSSNTCSTRLCGLSRPSVGRSRRD
jgi:hypothetical protein